MKIKKVQVAKVEDDGAFKASGKACEIKDEVVKAVTEWKKERSMEE